LILRPLCPNLFPYTTLFRSKCRPWRCCSGHTHASRSVVRRAESHLTLICHCSRVERSLIDSRALSSVSDLVGWICRTGDIVDGRSEEHTSELQSRENLVCRL